MSNPSKTKGTRNESNLVDEANDWAGRTVARRECLHGNRDEGDIILDVDGMTLVWEAKWREKYPGEAELDGFKQQALDENVAHGGDGGIFSVNLYRKGILRQEVWMLGSTWMDISAIEHGEFEYDPHSWVRVTLCDFFWTCFGAPAWGLDELKVKA